MAKKFLKYPEQYQVNLKALKNADNPALSEVDFLEEIEKLKKRKLMIEMITPILTSIIVFSKNIFTSSYMRKAQIFKQIRNEYLKDKIIGYYYFQSFFGFFT